MQELFRPLVEAVQEKIPAAFGSRCLASYLHGSIRVGDAVPGVSDLDYMFILSDGPTEADQVWLRETERLLQKRYPVVAQVHLSPLSVVDLQDNAFARFALRYNAMRLHGEDVLASLEAAGIPTPAPDAAFAKGRLGFARACLEQALAGQEPDCTGPLPVGDAWVARKYARYFVVIEGAYFLMAQGLFRSFEVTEVMPALYAVCQDFREQLCITARVLEDPAGTDSHAYLLIIAPLVAWMHQQIEKA